MVVKDLLLEGIKDLNKKENINAQLEVRLILSHILGVDKSYLYGHEDLVVCDYDIKSFRDHIRMRKEDLPLAYILKEKEFMGMKLYIEEGVLIPRGDTEIIVEFIIAYIKDKYKDKPFNLLDIGIGSGAISLSLAKEFPNANIIGLDLYDKPLRVSKINKKALGLENIKFIKSNLFSSLDKKAYCEYFDIIVSNPPYIKEEDIQSLDRDVKDYEPREALSGGKDGLDFYRKITKEAREYLKKDGLLVYEIGYDQAKMVEGILSKDGYKDIKAINDLENRNRLIKANK